MEGFGRMGWVQLHLQRLLWGCGWRQLRWLHLPLEQRLCRLCVAQLSRLLLLQLLPFGRWLRQFPATQALGVL